MAHGEGWRVYHTRLGRLIVYTHPCVYTPAEDSLLAVEALEYLSTRGYEPSVVLDLGTGTGIIALAASRAFPSAQVVAVDVDSYAVEAARRTLEGTRSVVLACNWTTCIRGPVDLAIVNPPYLPVEDEDGCKGLARAWSGSPRLLEDVCRQAAGISDIIVMVYSSLSGWDPYPCLEENSFEIIRVLGEAYFMEKLYAVIAARG